MRRQGAKRDRWPHRYLDRELKCVVNRGPDLASHAKADDRPDLSANHGPERDAHSEPLTSPTDPASYCEPDQPDPASHAASDNKAEDRPDVRDKRGPERCAHG